jgi:cytochrome c551/c552
METNGASIYAARGTAGPPATGALAKAEQCMFCHSPTSAFGLGIKAVHAIK